MSDAKKSIDEEYYPISEEILSSFSRFRPSIDLFIFKEDILSLYPIARKEQRLTDAKIEEIALACKNGCLFVSRSDKHIYVNHLAKQSEFVLIDENLRGQEIREILLRALTLRLQNIFEQALQISYKGLYKDLMVLTEYVWQDKSRLDYFMDNLYIEEDNLISHTINTIFVGVWLYLNTAENPQRKTLDKIIQGLALHDIGYTKVPAFVINKRSKLNKEEIDKITAHPRHGLLLAQKMEVIYDEVSQIIMQHHELLDGKGYPNRLNSSSITEWGMLGAVADSFSSMITKRPRDKKLGTLEAAKLLSKDACYSQKYTYALEKAYSSIYKNR